MPFFAGGLSVEDHIHLLFGLSRTRTVAQVVENVKTSSSKWIKGKGAAFGGVSLAGGLWRFLRQSVQCRSSGWIHPESGGAPPESDVPGGIRRFLRRYQIAYDENYVWD